METNSELSPIMEYTGKLIALRRAMTDAFEHYEANSHDPDFVQRAGVLLKLETDRWNNKLLF